MERKWLCKKTDTKLGSLMSPECTSGSMECLCVLHGAHNCFFSIFVPVSSEKLESEKLNVAEVTQSEIAQKQKLQTVLEKINETLKLPPRSIKWNVDCKFCVCYTVLIC